VVAVLLLAAPTAPTAPPDGKGKPPDAGPPPGKGKPPKDDPVDPGPPAPIDYTQIEGVSQPTFTETRSDELDVPMADGTTLFVRVVRPAADGPFPVILEASPYHGTLADRDGIRILPDARDASGRQIGLTGYFAPRGYAVVMVDLRGTGKSQGCLDHLGPNDASDLKQIVEWAASQDWSNGRVGMTGHSYVGSTPSLAAAMQPEGLETIVPSAGLASMYDHQFQGGVPFFLQWAGPQWAYPYLATVRHTPPVGTEPAQNSNTGDSFGRNQEYAYCGPANSALTSGEPQLSGAYADWHAQRDWRDEATAAPIPVFMVHGVNDNAARVTAMDWFHERDNAGDKIWLGQWNHGSGCCPNRRGMQWTAALHAWFDKHLAQRDVETGPPVEVFLADGAFHDAQNWARTEVITGTRWPVETQPLTFYPSGMGLSTDAPAAEGSSAFTGEGRGGTSVKPAGDPFTTGGVTFATEPFADDLVLAGLPELQLAASSSSPRVHLIAGLYDEWESDGGTIQRRRISEFAINPELREGSDDPQPVVPGQRYTLEPPGFTMAHHLREGHRLLLRVTTSSPDKVPTFSADPRVTVFTGPDATSVTVPVVAAPSLFPDTVGLEPAPPLGPAAPPYNAQITALIANQQSGAMLGTVHPFEIPANTDNARAEVVATWPGGGDMELYLERQNPGTTTFQTVVQGTSSAEGEERLVAPRLSPGQYRFRLFNVNAPPNTTADVTATYFNQAGEPGS
jgi:putative CocE/NonD family hydrolase